MTQCLIAMIAFIISDTQVLMVFSGFSFPLKSVELEHSTSTTKKVLFCDQACRNNLPVVGILQIYEP